MVLELHSDAFVVYTVVSDWWLQEVGVQAVCINNQDTGEVYYDGRFKGDRSITMLDHRWRRDGDVLFSLFFLREAAV